MLTIAGSDNYHRNNTIPNTTIGRNRQDNQILISQSIVILSKKMMKSNTHDSILLIRVLRKGG